jgi:hypothetical protein
MRKRIGTVIPALTLPSLILMPFTYGQFSNSCSDFATHVEAQACYEYCLAKAAGNVHYLDGDNDCTACESLP